MTTIVTPDLTGIFVYIATPAGDGTFDHLYVKGKDEAVASIEQFGGKAEWGVIKNCSDLGLARARLLGSFVRQTKFTHMMMIDSDMGYSGIDVVRLLHLREDFIGAAGPMKGYPIKFAAVVMDEDMNPIPVECDQTTGVVEVHEVGMAFVLISRSCAERMIEAYKDTLTFGDPRKNQEPEVALFDPMTISKRRYSEDFAFCKRWRDIGGKVKLLADVRLAHTGSHTFEGSLLDQFIRDMGNVVRH